MTDYTNLGISGLAVRDGQFIDLETKKSKPVEEVEETLWDSFLQGWDDATELYTDQEWIEFLREYQSCLREFINEAAE